MLSDVFFLKILVSKHSFTTRVVLLYGGDIYLYGSNNLALHA